MSTKAGSLVRGGGRGGPRE